MSRRWHVLSVVGNLGFGGDEYRLVSMVRSMDRVKYRFSVVVLVGDQRFDKTHGSLASELKAAGATLHLLDHGSSPSWLPRRARSAWKILRSIRAVIRLIRTQQVDLVDARISAGMIIGVPAAVLTRRPSVSTLYDAVPWDKFPFWRLVRWLTLNLTDAVITDSAVRQKELKGWLWKPSAKVWNIANGTAVPLPDTDPDSLRLALGMSSDKSCRVIAQIAGIVPYKGQMILAEAARTVLAQVPDVIFLIIGYSRGNEIFECQLRDRIEATGLSGRVIVTGYPGPIGDVWQVVDIHVHASLFDSLPNAIIEGMSLGKPAVVTAVGGVPEAVEDCVTGLVVKSGDAPALASAMLRLLQDPSLAARLGAAARERYQQRYKPTVMATALDGCFMGLLQDTSDSSRKAA